MVEGERDDCGVPFYKNSNPVYEFHNLWNSQDLIPSHHMQYEDLKVMILGKTQTLRP